MELENSKTEAEKREERMQKANELCLIAVFAMFGVLMRQGIGKGEKTFHTSTVLVVHKD